MASFVSGPWQANCYLLAADDSDQCLIIDPGVDAAQTIDKTVVEQQLSPVAVLATHGHLDHVGDAAKVADKYGIPVWIHSADRHLLLDPLAGLGQDAAGIVAQLYPEGLKEPAEVLLYDQQPGFETADAQAKLQVAGIEFSLIHAPGHTQGCVMLMTEYPGGKPVSHLVFTGDVLFAGSIGRTDLPGGNSDQMLRTLAGPVLSLPDTAGILPGHGPQSYLATERVNNPYLQPNFLGQEV